MTDSSPKVSKGYRVTEIGILPDGWEIRSLDSLFTFSGGYPVSREELGDEGLCYLHYGDIHLSPRSYIDVNSDYINIPKLNISLSDIPKNAQLNDGDVVFVDASEDVDGASRHHAVTNPNNVPFIAGLHTIVAKQRYEDLSNKYKRYCFQTASLNEQFRTYVVGTKVSGISKSNIKKIMIPIPPKSEQEAIAEALSDVDELLESLEQLIAKKRLIKQGTMQKLLKPKEDWVEKRLGNTADLKARIGWQGLTTAEYMESGGYFLVTGTDFKNGYIDWENCFYVDKSRFDQDKNIQLKVNDILVTKDGTIGKTALIPELEKPATLNSGVFVVRPINEAFDQRFFYYLLCSEQFLRFLDQLTAGSTINHLYQKDFVHFAYRLPATLQEQQQIAATLFDMDCEIAELEIKLTKSRDIKTGMMQQLLIGKIRLIQPASNVAKSREQKQIATTHKPHSSEFEDAVLIAVLAACFASARWPLSRFRYTKFSYLLRRRSNKAVNSYLKKAAGPYNPRTRYGGPERITVQKGYSQKHSNGTYSGFLAGEKIEEAEKYFETWFGKESLTWLKQFQFEKHDQLELLTTVDMAMVDLRNANKDLNLDTVKQLIYEEPEWAPKLDRSIFSDDNIQRAINRSLSLFGQD